MSKRLLTVVPFMALAALGAGPARSAEIAAGSLQPAATPQSFACPSNTDVVCLDGNRFEITAMFSAPGGGGAGNAHMVKLTDDSAYMWFFSSDNVEAVMKVLDGCALDSSYWFFAGGLTNVDVVITVTDSMTLTKKQYHNPQGTPFSPIQDTGALHVCP